MTDHSAAAAPAHQESRIPIGQIIGQGFATLWRNILPFGFLALLAWLPTALVGASVGAASVTEASQVVPWILLLGFLANGLLNGVVVYGTFMDLRGQPASMGACMRRGIAVLFPILGVVIVYVLILSVGFVLLVIPGIIALVMLYVSVPVAVVEHPGVFASLGRSRELTKNNPWRLLAIFLIVTVITQVAVAVGRIVGGAISPFAGLSLEWILNSVFAAFTAIVTTVAYYELRKEKEGMGIEKLAAVFD